MSAPANATKVANKSVDTRRQDDDSLYVYAIVHSSGLNVSLSLSRSVFLCLVLFLFFLLSSFCLFCLFLSVVCISLGGVAV